MRWFKTVEYRLKTPISKREVGKLKVGDVIYISGTIYTARDSAHRRALEYVKKGLKLPVDFRGAVIYHCGPVAKKIDGQWRIIAAGPTTSARMEFFEDEFIKTLGVRVIVGKGGMGDRTAGAARKYGAVYGVFTGGAAALAASTVREVKGVEWLDLGIPEAIWILEVEGFGPVIVTIDSHGGDIHKKIADEVSERLRELIGKL